MTLVTRAELSAKQFSLPYLAASQAIISLMRLTQRHTISMSIINGAVAVCVDIEDNLKRNQDQDNMQSLCNLSSVWI